MSSEPSPVLDPRLGLGEPRLDETYVKEEVTRRSGSVLVLADSSKLHERQVPAWLPLQPGWRLITDGGIDPVAGDLLTSAGVEVVVAG